MAGPLKRINAKEVTAMRTRVVQLIFELLFHVCTYLINRILDTVYNKIMEVFNNRRK